MLARFVLIRNIHQCVLINTCICWTILPYSMGVVILATSRHNITLEEDVYSEFAKYAGKKGIKISTWINIQMKQFIEEEKMLEEMRKKRSE